MAIQSASSHSAVLSTQLFRGWQSNSPSESLQQGVILAVKTFCDGRLLHRGSLTRKSAPAPLNGIQMQSLNSEAMQYIALNPLRPHAL